MVAAALILGLLLASPDVGEESPDVFLARATLQQYLSRVVRKDWDGARRLTHPKALAVLDQLKKRTGGQPPNLAPWANGEVQLKTFHFAAANQIAPRAVLLPVNEET